jgi:hypothetical protein
MEVNGQLHTPVALLQGKEPLSPTKQEARRVSEPVCLPTGNQNTDRPTNSLVTMATELQQSMCILI